jgi:serine/threonine-protein kinase RsbW
MVGEVVALEIPARAEFVALARLVVSALAATDSELADERVDDLKIAVSEACTNAIEAHDAIATSERVRVRCQTDDRGLEVRIEDQGPGFDPTQVNDRMPESNTDRLKVERGLGIPLIRALVDEVDIDSSEAGTAVRLVMLHAADDAV